MGDIGPRIVRQFGEGTLAQSRFLPTGQGFVDRAQIFVVVRVVQRGAYFLPLCIAIAATDIDGVEAIQYVQLGQTNGVDGVNTDRVLHQHGIKPATTSVPAGGSAFFPADCRQMSPDIIK